LLAVLVGACSSSGGGTEPGPTPAISLALASSSASIAQGGSAPVGATLTRSGGFTGTVNLTVEGVPAGVTGAVSGVSTTGGVTTATVTINVAASTVPGTYNLTVRATGSGVADATAAFTLTVTAVTVGGFTIALNPTSLSMVQGAAGNTTVSINRTGGFAGAVTLAVEGAPTGLGSNFTPNNTTGTSSVLGLSAGASLAAQTYTVTIRATAAGLPDRTATLPVTVTTSGGGGGGNVSVSIGCLLPVWFAYRDGTGPWTPVTGSAGVFTFNISQSKGGFVFATSNPPSGMLNVLLMSRAELTAGPLTFCPTGPTSTKFVNGTVAGLGAGDIAHLSLGGASGSASVNGGFSILGIATGPQDLIGFRHNRTVDQGGAGNPDRGIIRRDLDPANAASLPVLDFTASESFAAATATVNVTNLAGGEGLTHTMGYRSGASCSFGSLYTFGGTTTPATFPITGIPAAQQRGTDIHQINVVATDGASGSRLVQESFTALANRSVTLPPGINPTITTLGGNYKRLQSVHEVPAVYTTGTILTYISFAPVRTVTITASSAWLGGTAATIGLDDFTGLAGWNASYAPASAATGTWSVQVNGSNISGAANLCRPDGRTISANRSGTF
jgi:hypothetical protein